MGLKFIQTRLKEYSTWYGIVQIILAFQLFEITDAQANAVLGLISAVFFAGAASIVTPDKSV